MPRQRDDGHVRPRLLERSRRDQPIHPRHRDVHDDDVGLEIDGALDGGRAVAGLGDHFHVGLSVDEQPQTVPDGHVVVGEQYAEGARLSHGW